MKWIFLKQQDFAVHASEPNVGSKKIQFVPVYQSHNV